MLLIAGLGNPEKEYKGTRHNIGFETLNKLAFDHGIAITKTKFNALLGEGQLAGQKVLLVKPQTYMNMSGCAIRDIMCYYKIPASHIVVVYDDADLPLGKIRLRPKGSAGTHNGMKSVIYQLETDEFLRLRVGVGAKPDKWDMADYVLSRFAPEEKDDMIDGVTKATDALETLLRLGPEEAMNKFNGQ